MSQVRCFTIIFEKREADEKLGSLIPLEITYLGAAFPLHADVGLDAASIACLFPLWTLPYLHSICMRILHIYNLCTR